MSGRKSRSLAVRNHYSWIIPHMDSANESNQYCITPSSIGRSYSQNRTIGYNHWNIFRWFLKCICIHKNIQKRNITLEFSGCEPNNEFAFPKPICIIVWLSQNMPNNNISDTGGANIDKVFFCYMRCVLHVKSTTNNIILVGECGQIPPSVSTHITAICYLNRLQIWS